MLLNRNTYSINYACNNNNKRYLETVNRWWKYTIWKPTSATIRIGCGVGWYLLININALQSYILLKLCRCASSHVCHEPSWPAWSLSHMALVKLLIFPLIDDRTWLTWRWKSDVVVSLFNNWIGECQSWKKTNVAWGMSSSIANCHYRSLPGMGSVW